MKTRVVCFDGRNTFGVPEPSSLKSFEGMPAVYFPYLFYAEAEIIERDGQEFAVFTDFYSNAKRVLPYNQFIPIPLVPDIYDRADKFHSTHRYEMSSDAQWEFWLESLKHVRTPGGLYSETERCKSFRRFAGTFGWDESKNLVKTVENAAMNDINP